MPNWKSAKLELRSSRQLTRHASAADDCSARSRRQRCAIALTRRFLQVFRGGINGIGIILQRLCRADNFLFRFLVAFFFNAFTHAGKGLGAVPGVEARRIDQVLKPRTARQAVRVSEFAFCLNQFSIERLQWLRAAGGVE